MGRDTLKVRLIFLAPKGLDGKPMPGPDNYCFAAPKKIL